MSIMPQDRFVLRKMAKEDLPDLVRIESVSQGSPWTELTFKTCFEQAFEGWVLELEGHIAGYIVLGMQAGECHVLNLCIAHEHQRKGYGRLLMKWGISEAKSRHISIVYLEVRRSNVAAIALYTKLQFRLIGERRDYYHTSTGPEDALVYAISLEETEV